MRWSIEELFKMLSWQWTGWWWRELIESPKSVYRNIKTIIHWIFTGYTHESLWSLDNWFDEIIYFRLKKFAAYDRMGYPGDDGAETEEQWQEILGTMVEGFEEIINEAHGREISEFIEEQDIKKLKFDEWHVPEEMFKRQEEAYIKSKKKKDLFWKWYEHLWD